VAGETAIVPPRQARTRASWERVLEEGVALLASGGYAALTIAALCERARVTAPTIYARAGDKESLLLAIYERAMARIDAADPLDPVDERWAALDPDALVRTAVGDLAALWLTHAGLLRAIVHRSATDPEVRRRGSERSQELGRRFRAVLLVHHPASAADAESAADTCFRVVYAALVQRVVFGADFESDRPLDDATFISALGDMAARYLHAEERT
jgi:AcrR family transcriptional regulator